MATAERKPWVEHDYKGEQEVVLSLYIPGLRPSKSKRSIEFDTDHYAENGDVDVTFLNKGRGLDARIEVTVPVAKGKDKKKKSETETTVWRLYVRQLPSRIDREKSFWVVNENWVIITLTKLKERGRFIDWEPLVKKNSLEQYREVEEDMDEEETFDPSKDVFPITNITIVATDRSNHGRQAIAREPP